jgi:lipopolysaccharide/colanic/teichoic acid biosynthesis glycosyltransferase
MNGDTPLRRAGRWRRERLLLIGRVALTEQILTALEAQPGRVPTIVGIVDDLIPGDPLPPKYALFGPVSRLADIVGETQPDRVLVALGERRSRTPIRALVESCVARGIVVEHAADYYERLTGKLAIESLAPTSIVFSRRFGPSLFDCFVARTLSLAVAVAGLVLLAPLMALIAIAVKLESGGPVLFVHERIGARGRPFKLMKFRTMRPSDRRQSEWECDNRDRVTRLGRWLRAFRLDELPQFVNVLRGEMNLVGPRPHPVSNFELFTLVSRNVNEVTGSAIGYYTLRTMVRPGLTGWAQVRYRYANNIEEEIEKLKYDLYYVKYASAPLDLRILFQTIKVVLCGHWTTALQPAAANVEPPKPLGLSPDVTRAHAA